MKLLNADTFDPTSFDSDYTLVVWFTNITSRLQKEIDIIEAIENVDVYGIDLNIDDNKCLVDYYGYDVSLGTYFTLYTVSELYLATKNYEDVEIVKNLEEE